MANPTEATNRLCNLAASTSEQTINLDRHRLYAVLHNGIDVSESPDTNLVFLATDSAVVADGSEGEDKAVLGFGAQIPLPPRTDTLRFRCAAGAPTFTLIPQRAVHHND